MIGTQEAGLTEGAKTLNDGVGCTVTAGIDNKSNIVLHLADCYLDQSVYALLTRGEARRIARYLNEMADRADEDRPLNPGDEAVLVGGQQ